MCHSPSLYVRKVDVLCDYRLDLSAKCERQQLASERQVSSGTHQPGPCCFNVLLSLFATGYGSHTV